MTEAIAHQIRLAALDLALADADRRFGPIGPELIAKADAELFAKPRRKSPGRRRR
ncbi:MAG TPA: hypothetical protein VFQ65_24025 [Kofleriaceae bacterium]|nr:hypothetical protein [Kofleriaceae bacterium]